MVSVEVTRGTIRCVYELLPFKPDNPKSDTTTLFVRCCWLFENKKKRSKRQRRLPAYTSKSLFIFFPSERLFKKSKFFLELDELVINIVLQN